VGVTQGELLMSNPARMVLVVGACGLTLAATAPSPGADGATSVWQGVYTKAQAERGRANYVAACASCHGTQLQGDTDAPDLAGQPAEAVPKAGNGFDQGKVNGSGAAGTLGAFAKNRKPWTPPKQILAPEDSAALRDRLLAELGSLASEDDSTGWAQGALAAKNTLRDIDAAVVETAFASRMAELADGALLPRTPRVGRPATCHPRLAAHNRTRSGQPFRPLRLRAFTQRRPDGPPYGGFNGRSRDRITT
jgi:cytochrome c553